MIIAFTGYAGSGKDTAAQVLIDKYGFEKKCFADAVREAMEIVNPIVGTPFNNVCQSAHVYRYTEAINEYGYVNAKQFGRETQFMMISG